MQIRYTLPTIALMGWLCFGSTLFSEPVADDATTAASDPFSIPADSRALIDFVIRLRGEETSNEQYKQELHTIVAAGEKLLKHATTVDKALPNYDRAVGIYFFIRVDLIRASKGDFTTVADELKIYLSKADTMTKESLWAAMTLANYLQQKNPERSRIFCDTTIAILSQRKENQAAATVGYLNGIKRFSNLVGSAAQIHGTTMDGRDFDLSEIRGKIVLVEFWTTWCGPCLAELPNLRQLYDAYHDKGFEVVSISLDERRPALEAFLEKEPLPWVVLHDQGWDENKNARHYGVTTVPTVLLVDRTGKILSTNARGEELQKQLAKVFENKGEQTKQTETAN